MAYESYAVSHERVAATRTYELWETTCLDVEHAMHHGPEEGCLGGLGLPIPGLSPPLRSLGFGPLPQAGHSGEQSLAS